VKVAKLENVSMRLYFMPILVVVVFGLANPPKAAAFTDGSGWTQVTYLIKILEENIRRYYQLKTMIELAKDQRDYLRLVNSGLDNSLGLIESLPIKDERVLSEIRNFKKAVEKISEIYGAVPKSKEELMQRLHDQTISESLRMINDFKEYSVKQEENSIRVAIDSRAASPKGAMRMQAETSAQILRSLSQLIRLNTQMLKLQSEQFGMQNKMGKDSVSNFQRVNQDLGKSFQELNPKMSLIKF
tara:strand:- start:17960 stop:18688 length:729 start_codon:yes stop_codon:yes gene_type:complete